MLRTATFNHDLARKTDARSQTGITQMGSLRKIATGIALPALLSLSAVSNAGLISGPSARAQFENYQATLGDTLQTFDGFPAQTDLTTQIPGLTFETTFKRFIPPPGPVSLPVHVICDGGNPYGTVCSDTDMIISGTGTNGGATDGQSVYEVAFDTGMLRAGLDRIFNPFSLTRFYSGATLLAEHQNTANVEFVGYVSDAANLITRIEMDGLLCDVRTNTFCVGYSDNLFYGNVPEPDDNGGGDGEAPVPATWLLMLPALWAMRRRLRA